MTKSVHVKEDAKLGREKQKIINSFRQGHIIENYGKLDEEEKSNLNEEIELLELDLVDLVIILS